MYLTLKCTPGRGRCKGMSCMGTWTWTRGTRTWSVQAPQRRTYCQCLCHGTTFGTRSLGQPVRHYSWLLEPTSLDNTSLWHSSIWWMFSFADRHTVMLICRCYSLVNVPALLVTSARSRRCQHRHQECLLPHSLYRRVIPSGVP